MAEVVKLRYVGTSLSITLPAVQCRELGWNEHDLLETSIDGAGLRVRATGQRGDPAWHKAQGKRKLKAKRQARRPRR